jgi:hypothetical protein
MITFFLFLVLSITSGTSFVGELQVIKFPVEIHTGDIPTFCSIDRPATTYQSLFVNENAQVPIFFSLEELTENVKWFIYLDKIYDFNTLKYPLSLRNFTYFNNTLLSELGLVENFGSDYSKFVSNDEKSLTFPSMLVILFNFV